VLGFGDFTFELRQIEIYFFLLHPILHDINKADIVRLVYLNGRLNDPS
jgi:hypothetical protein